jgi:uncharacterized protein
MTASGIKDLFDYERPEEYSDVVITRNVMMTTRDGIELSTDVYLPARDGVPVDGQFPAIMDRTPYDKALRGPFVNDPEYFVKRGYAFVFQDTRGHGGSGGDFKLFGVGHDGRDGYDAVEWIAQQPWSNGKVATNGWSADCMTQLSLAVEAPPHLTAMYLSHGPSNYYQDLASTNGALRWCHGVAYSFRNAFLDRAVREDPVLEARLQAQYESIEDWYYQTPVKLKKLFEGVPSVERFLSEWLDNRDFNDYWKQPGYYFEDYYDNFPDIPMFFMGAWYDFFLRGTIRNFVGLSQRQETPKFLLVGPGLHGPGPARRPWQGDVYFGEQSCVEWNSLRLGFFDQFLKGAPTGNYDKQWVKTFLMGGGDGKAVDVAGTELPIEVYGRWAAETATSGPRVKMDHGGQWQEADGWPIAGTEETSFFLHGGGTLSTDSPTSLGSVTRYEFDPKHPVPQIGGDWTHRPQFINQPGEVTSAAVKQAAGPGPRDQIARRGWLGCTDDLPLWVRPDIVSFSTPVLTEPIDVVGDLKVVLYVSSSAVDTDFTFKLVDEHPPNADYPGGFAMLIRDGIIRTRYRDSFEKPELMEPGTIYRLEVDFWATANSFGVGHRLRLDISSSNFPSFDVNPNTGEPIGYHTHTLVALNSVHHDAEHPSRLILPVRTS